MPPAWLRAAFRGRVLDPSYAQRPAAGTPQALGQPPASVPKSDPVARGEPPCSPELLALCRHLPFRLNHDSILPSPGHHAEFLGAPTIPWGRPTSSLIRHFEFSSFVIPARVPSPTFQPPPLPPPPPVIHPCEFPNPRIRKCGHQCVTITKPPARPPAPPPPQEVHYPAGPRLVVQRAGRLVTDRSTSGSWPPQQPARIATPLLADPPRELRTAVNALDPPNPNARSSIALARLDPPWSREQIPV